MTKTINLIQSTSFNRRKKIFGLLEDCARTTLRTPVWKMGIKRMQLIGKRSVGVVISCVAEGKGKAGERESEK